MRYLLIIPLFLALPFSALAITGPAYRADFSSGQPAVTADATTNCTNAATSRFDFVAGAPAVVIDSTATCATPGVITAIGSAKHTVVGGATTIVGGVTIFQ